MCTTYVIPMALAALVAGSTVASAQRFRDDPPGYAFQKRGIIEEQGGDPWHYPHYGTRYRGYRSYGAWDGAYAWQPMRRHRYRSWRW